MEEENLRRWKKFYSMYVKAGEPFELIDGEILKTMED